MNKYKSLITDLNSQYESNINYRSWAYKYYNLYGLKADCKFWEQNYYLPIRKEKYCILYIAIDSERNLEVYQENK